MPIARRDDDPDPVAGVAQRGLDELDGLDDEHLVVGQHLPRLEDPADHARMEDPFELPEPARIREHDIGQLATIDLLVLAEDRCSELLHDRAVPGGAAKLLVLGDGVGVEHPRAELAKHRRDGGLPRPDRTGEPDDERAHDSLSAGPAEADHSS